MTIQTNISPVSRECVSLYLLLPPLSLPLSPSLSLSLLPPALINHDVFVFVFLI